MRPPNLKSFHMSQLRITIVCLALLAGVAGDLSAQKSKEEKQEAAIKQQIDSKKYVFVAERALPMRGASRHLTSMYTLRVSKDSVIADLPYMGRAYAGAGYGGTEGGIKFVSAKNDYKITPRKKGGWDIRIKPLAARDSDVRELSLTVFNNGNASLQVLNNNRDQISFDGYIETKK